MNAPRRMSLRHAAHTAECPKPTFAEIQNDSQVLPSVNQYAVLLPSDKNSAILDIGFGGGWFLAACLKLGYTNLSGAEFALNTKLTSPTGRKAALPFTRSMETSEPSSATYPLPEGRVRKSQNRWKKPRPIPISSLST